MELTAKKQTIVIETTPESFDLDDVPITHKYMLPWALILAAASSCQTGWAIAENGQVGYILSEKLGWKENGNEIALMTTCTVLGALGLAFGTNLGGNIGSKYGLRKVLLIANFLNFFINILKQIENTYILFMGRFLFGLCCGV